MFSEDNATHPVGCDSSMKIAVAVRRTFLEFELLGWCGSLLLTIMAVLRSYNF
jgi:hypothetical protein